MRIVTRLVDVLEGGLNPADTIGKFIVYLQMEDGKKLEADICYGNTEMRASEDSYQWCFGPGLPIDYEVVDELQDKQWAHNFITTLNPE